MAGVRVVSRWRFQQRHASNLGCFRLRHQAEGQVRNQPFSVRVIDIHNCSNEAC